jgi:PAS domain S-box-containing protein
MDEQALLLAAAGFLVLLTLTMARLGRGSGGIIWAVAWFALYGSGLATILRESSPASNAAIPLFGTTFSACILGGALVFSGRCVRFPRQLAFVSLGLVAIRWAIQPLVSIGVNESVGSAIFSTAVVASSYVLLRPVGRAPTLWDRILGFSFPALAVVSILYAVSQFLAIPVVVGIYWWLLVSISIGFIQVSAFIARATARMDTLLREADRSRHALDSVAERYREVTEQASDLISEVDESGEVLYANPAHETILGIKPEEVVGESVGALIAEKIELDGGGEFRDVFAGSPRLEIVSLRHRDGTERIVECNIRPFTLASGKRRIVVTSRDITERVAAERAREEGREALESLVEQRTAALNTSIQALERSERLAAMGTLAAGIAHQINNPIGSIQMSSEFALGSEGAEDEREIWREALRNGVDQSKRCGRIVSSMLRFARNEPTAKSEEDLAAILHRICEQTDDYARNQRATLDTRGVEGPLPILGSAIELEQALLNIVRNAMESSREAVRVEICATRAAGFARITVSDNGGGMEELEVDRAFDPFFTTRLGHGGTGLGLSVAHGVVTDHGGTLSIESEAGAGTTMPLSIPLRGHPDAEANRAISVDSNHSIQSSLGASPE